MRRIPSNAHIFIDYMLRPEVIAAVTNYVNYANGNATATQLVNADVAERSGHLSDAEKSKRSWSRTWRDTEETTRLMTRLWTKFKTGK